MKLLTLPTMALAVIALVGLAGAAPTFHPSATNVSYSSAIKRWGCPYIGACVRGCDGRWRNAEGPDDMGGC